MAMVTSIIESEPSSYEEAAMLIFNGDLYLGQVVPMGLLPFT